MKKQTKECPPNKVLNPKTNRCVSRTGVTGKRILNKNKQSAKAKPNKIKKQTQMDVHYKKTTPKQPPKANPKQPVKNKIKTQTQIDMYYIKTKPKQPKAKPKQPAKNKIKNQTQIDMYYGNR